MIAPLAAAAETPWLGVDWGSIGLVFVVSLVATVVVAGSYAFGTRLLAVGAPDIEVPEGSEVDGPEAIVRPRTRPRPASATAAASLFFAVGVAATIYGIYLVIPIFHQ
ncbi:hypothetical protein [Microbacterium sp. P01]|uniref:hypothetical protein n=1 Tax=unclassified Microbacterium TaxID=2609290 RepID=UPI00367256EF